MSWQDTGMHDDHDISLLTDVIRPISRELAGWSIYNEATLERIGESGLYAKSFDFVARGDLGGGKLFSHRSGGVAHPLDCACKLLLCYTQMPGPLSDLIFAV
jgi:hypothetical protein